MTHANDFVDEIADADRRCVSWREKLRWIEDCISDDNFELNRERLVYLAIYLRFIGTGKAPCSEDGRHYRPSHHAKTSHRIHKRLAEITTSDNAFIIRKIYPWLPSYSDSFIRTEPLTRIRDIAHRNDIPKALKREIKHTLQNKLHRCAGPEDLATSRALLEKITAPDVNYSPNLVKEFKKFHNELKEFFNARSLKERLEAIKASSSDRNFKVIAEFLEAKENADTLEQRVHCFQLLTMLRRRLDKKNRGDVNSEAQTFLLADIGLEDFSFVLLSQIINHFDIFADEIPWSWALKCLALTVENLRLSRLDSKECRAIKSELETWSQGLSPRNHEQLIRLKASGDRCLQLAEGYCDKILTWLPERVERLGLALGVGKHVINFFCETDIRRHLVFQLSKLAELLIKTIRHLAGLPPWDVVVPEKVAGRLVSISSLYDLTDPLKEPVVVLLKRAEGDEEIPAGVVGIIVKHEMPRLSHLSVRARQSNVAFVLCQDPDRLALFEKAIGKCIVLEVSEEMVRLEEIAVKSKHERAKGVAGKTHHKNIKIPEKVHTSDRLLLYLNQVTRESGGSKAYMMGRLERLSKMEGAGFSTPPGIVIPFGVMEQSLHSAPALEEAYHTLVDRLNTLPNGPFIEALRKLKDDILQLAVPLEIVSHVKAHFAQDSRLMVRSSANCEDLESLSAAGLYDSIANVPLQDVARAVRQVWSSIWSGRAVLNRKNLNIPHHKISMAVLIQQMLVPEYSFIMHTANPINCSTDEIYIELAVGLGETLASGRTPGTPYRMVVNKETGTVQLLAFASFSHALWPDTKGGLNKRTVDYSKIELSKNETFRNNLAERLGNVGRFVEENLEAPQDVEGLISEDKIYVVQSRPQQGKGIKRSSKRHCLNAYPRILGLFQKRIDGDDALLDLASLRFEKAGLGTEFYAETQMELDHLLTFKPMQETVAAVHLDRGISLFDEEGRRRIMDFAQGFKERLFGLVVHDQVEIITHFEDYVTALREIDSMLREISGSPYFFIEYAVGIEPECFIKLFKVTQDLDKVSACLDTGHIGLWHTRNMFSRNHPGKDVCDVTPDDPELPKLIEVIQNSVSTSIDTIRYMIQELASLKKPLHFHLHDGHPLSTVSPFGISDHLSFLDKIPIPFEYRGKRHLNPMFGPSGLLEIVNASLQLLGPGGVSYSLEIHPTQDRLPLADAHNLFSHWKDKCNAEQMNNWLAVLLRNHELVLHACKKVFAERAKTMGYQEKTENL